MLVAWRHLEQIGEEGVRESTTHQSRQSKTQHPGIHRIRKTNSGGTGGDCHDRHEQIQNHKEKLLDGTHCVIRPLTIV